MKVQENSESGLGTLGKSATTGEDMPRGSDFRLCRSYGTTMARECLGVSGPQGLCGKTHPLFKMKDGAGARRTALGMGEALERRGVLRASVWTLA